MSSPSFAFRVYNCRVVHIKQIILCEICYLKIIITRISNILLLETIYYINDYKQLPRVLECFKTYNSGVFCFLHTMMEVPIGTFEVFYKIKLN